MPYINNYIEKCGGIILNPQGDKVLCVMNKYTLNGGEYKFGLPKGHLNNNESLAECAQREIFEETGLNFNLDEFKYFYKMRNVRMYIFKLDEYKQLKINDKSEIALLEWYTINELKQLTTNREIKFLISALNNYKNKTLIEFYRDITSKNINKW